jgi:uncharacterized lipoprotein YmbA
MTRRAAAFWLGLAGCVALAGCAAFTPRADSSHFFFLTAAAHEEEGAAGGLAPLAVGLADVRFPAYLERPELASRVAANELHFSPVARWAEPLGSGFARVLAVDLDAQLGAASVVRAPWYPAARLDCVLAVEVDHFETDAGGDAVLVARWIVRDALGKRVLRSGTSIHRRPAGGAAAHTPPGAAAAVAALSELIDDFSREMAAALRRAVPGAAPAGG